MDNQRLDTAAEPVDHDENEFMDTGVLHERPKGVKGQHVVREDEDDEDESEGTT